MKKQLNLGFITTFSGRWPQELPQQRMQEYGDWLEKNLPNVSLIKADRLGCTPETVAQIADDFRTARVDLVIMLYGAFTGDDVSAYLAQELGVPVILWAPYEVPFAREERLYANALVAMTMNAAALHRLGHRCHGVYGSFDDPRAADKIKNLVAAYGVKKALSHTLLGLLGYRPTAFYNCAFDEGLIRRTFGIAIEETDLKVVFDQMDNLPQAMVDADLAGLGKKYDLSLLPEGHAENHARLYLALRQVMEQQRYDYGVLKCWPEMGALHTTPCSVLGRLADEGVNIGCEGDVDAELAQIVQNLLTGLPTFITDMINIDEKENTMTYWHCGNAAPSLHNPKYDTLLKNHPLAGQGSAFYSSLKPGPVTVARFCNIGGVYRLFLLRGEAIDGDRYTRGSMVQVRVKQPVRELIETIIEQGIPHHYSVVWAEVADQMTAVAALLGIEVIKL